MCTSATAEFLADVFGHSQATGSHSADRNGRAEASAFFCFFVNFVQYYTLVIKKRAMLSSGRISCRGSWPAQGLAQRKIFTGFTGHIPCRVLLFLCEIRECSILHRSSTTVRETRCGLLAEFLADLFGQFQAPENPSLALRDA
ncbi:hypothetical protein BaRGS_00015723 [Batillaria attramentaria]|uniref:Uncharacterized protein n=1 Tax=Batillaria attramentaria TaxID=370345 RepID=A0ABD0L199_9CAEN